MTSEDDTAEDLVPANAPLVTHAARELIAAATRGDLAASATVLAPLSDEEVATVATWLSRLYVTHATTLGASPESIVAVADEWFDRAVSEEIDRGTERGAGGER